MNGGSEKANGPLATATAVVGLLAGAVAAVYMLGGLVVTLRMLHDDFGSASIVSVLGQLPREVVISTALLEVVAPAVGVGVIAALFYGIFDAPKDRKEQSDELNEGPHPVLLLAFIGVLSFVFTVPALYQACRSDDGLTVFVLGLIVFVFAVTYALIASGWFVLRKIGRRNWYRLPKAAAAGAVWAVLAATPVALLASLIPFDHAQVCVSGSAAPVQGLLLGEGSNRLLLEQEFGREASVVSLPTKDVSKVEYGDLSSVFSCSGVVTAPVAAAKLGGHGSEEELRLATVLRPRLRFDSRERWRPIAVSALLAERFEGGAGHGACPSGADPPCLTLKGLRELRRGEGAPAYIDIHGEPRDVTTYGSSSESCLRSPPALDCNSGPGAAIYYRRTTHEGRWYWDYWWFLRYNDYTGKFNHCVIVCGDHEGDWEGITVITTASTEPEILGAIYAAHKDRALIDGATLPTAGGHPLVWIATGTHASYPYDCDRNCKQYNGLPEDPHDGSVPWGGNRDAECEKNKCVRPLPEVGEPSEASLPIAGSWAGWPGKWGETCHDGCPGPRHRESSPASPGTQTRFQCPWVPTRRAQPAPDGSGLSDSEPVGDSEHLFALCRAQRGGG